MTRRTTLITGARYGRLRACERASDAPTDGRTRWLMLCDCGTFHVARTRDLKVGNTRSCGCLVREIAATISLRHGDARQGKRHPFYRTWNAMLDRCENPKAINWQWYGGRGITVCKAWHKWVAFRDYVETHLGPRPEGRPRWTLDRVDNDLGYQPGNLRWARGTEQMKNARPKGAAA
jgi:hypothetical protein